MRLLDLAILYALVGAGCAGALFVRRRARGADAVLLVAFWPLYAPFLLLAGAPPAAPPAAVAPLLLAARARVREIEALLAAPQLAAAAYRLETVDRLRRRRDHLIHGIADLLAALDRRSQDDIAPLAQALAALLSEETTCPPSSSPTTTVTSETS